MVRSLSLPKARGKLIVLEGIDGSGKATQTRLLVKRLKKVGVRVQTLSFPRYESHVSGKLIGECLTGAHGEFAALDPYIASILYALDRLEAKDRLEGWLARGDTVVLDRYVTSNQIHQGGKIHNAGEKKKFLEWLDYLEYRLFGLPRPSLVVHLNVPTRVSAALLKGAQQKKGSYLGPVKNKTDRVEQDKQYMENSRRAALELLTQEKHWKTVECVENGTLRSPEAIHEDVARLVQRTIRFPL